MSNRNPDNLQAVLGISFSHIVSPSFWVGQGETLMMVERTDLSGEEEFSGERKVRPSLGGTKLQGTFPGPQMHMTRKSSHRNKKAQSHVLHLVQDPVQFGADIEYRD